MTRRKQKVKQTLVREAGGCCAVCGYDRTVVNLHFHHVDPSKKSLSMSMRGGKSLDAFREEAKKCVLVCANCHGEIEAGVIESPPPGSKYMGHGMTHEPPDPATPTLPRIRINTGLSGDYPMLNPDTGNS